MYSFKSLHCYNCRAVILKLPELEITKLNGLNFVCDCCGHQNLLAEFKFYKSNNNDPQLNIFSMENLTAF